MTADQFAEALNRLAADTEHAGLDPEKILAAFEEVAEAIRHSWRTNSWGVYPGLTSSLHRPQGWYGRCAALGEHQRH